MTETPTQPHPEPDPEAAFLALHAGLAEVVSPFLVRASRAMSPFTLKLIADEAADAVLAYVSELEG